MQSLKIFENIEFVLRTLITAEWSNVNCRRLFARKKWPELASSTHMHRMYRCSSICHLPFSFFVSGLPPSTCICCFFSLTPSIALSKLSQAQGSSLKSLLVNDVPICTMYTYIALLYDTFEIPPTEALS